MRGADQCCIAERRAIETIGQGRPATGFLRYGDRVSMEARLESAMEPLFGETDQRVVASTRA